MEQGAEAGGKGMNVSWRRGARKSGIFWMPFLNNGFPGDFSHRERSVFLGMACRALSGPCSGGFSDGLMQEGIPYQMALFFKGEM